MREGASACVSYFSNFFFSVVQSLFHIVSFSDDHDSQELPCFHSPERLFWFGGPDHLGASIILSYVEIFHPSLGLHQFHISWVLVDHLLICSLVRRREQRTEKIANIAEELYC